MALTAAQEKYLKDKNIGKGAATGGAIKGAASGAAKGAAIGSIVPGIGTAVGGIVGGAAGLLKGLFGGKAKAKKEQEAARAALEQAAGEFNQKEDTRLARLGAGQSLLAGLQSRGFTNIDPETLAKLQARRELDPNTVGLSNPDAGAVYGGLGDALQTAEDYATQYGINAQDSTMEMAGPLASQIQTAPVAPTKIGQGVALEDQM